MFREFIIQRFLVYYHTNNPHLLTFSETGSLPAPNCMVSAEQDQTIFLSTSSVQVVGMSYHSSALPPACQYPKTQNRLQKHRMYSIWVVLNSRVLPKVSKAYVSSCAQHERASTYYTTTPRRINSFKKSSASYYCCYYFFKMSFLLSFRRFFLI